MVALRMNRYTKLSMISLLALLLLACGKPDAPEEAEAGTEEAAAVEAQPAPVAAPAAPAVSERRELALEDIDRWQRGIAAEKKAVQEAAARLSTSKEDAAKLEALHAATETSTLDAGAQAAGLDRDTYRRIRLTLSSAVSHLSPIEMEMDVAKMPPQMVEQMKQSREAALAQFSDRIPADVLAALKTRAAELRQQDKELVGERLKVAAAAR